MKLRTFLSETALAALCFAAASPVSAAIISPAGNIEGTIVQEWMTPTTPKGAADIDSDNIFGSSLGAVHWGYASRGEVGVGGGFGWHYVSDTTQYGGDARFPLIDDLVNPTQDRPGGIAAIGSPAGTFVFTLEGTAADYAGKTVRIGVMADNLGLDESPADMGKTYRLAGPGGGDSGAILLRGGLAGNSVPEMYFFDLTGVNPGDQFTLTAGTAGGQPGYIGPVSWDIATVPEPGSALLCAAGLGALLTIRRRRA